MSLTLPYPAYSYPLLFPAGYILPPQILPAGYTLLPQVLPVQYTLLLPCFVQTLLYAQTSPAQSLRSVFLPALHTPLLPALLLSALYDRRLLQLQLSLPPHAPTPQ